jgi:hypothetical protein
MATTRADRHLPLILNRRTKSDAERQAAFDALVVHLELTKKLERFRRARKGRGDKHEAAADFFMSLAYGLMQRIQAFAPPKKAKPRANAGQNRTYRTGGLLSEEWPIKREHQAKFVVEVERLKETNKWKTYTQVFNWLANKRPVTHNSKEAAKRLALIPARYRTLRELSSFRQAWKDIPKAVRESPYAYLPRPASAPEFFFLGRSSSAPGPGLLG